MSFEGGCQELGNSYSFGKLIFKGAVDCGEHGVRNIKHGKVELVSLATRDIEKYIVVHTTTQYDSLMSDV